MDMQTQAHIAITRPHAGKVSIVTGSTSGIGLGIARALEQVMIPPVDERDVYGLSGQPLCSGQPAEASADNYDVGAGRLHVSAPSSHRRPEARCR